MRARVSDLDAYRQFMADDEYDLDQLISRLMGRDEPSEAMRAGTALHLALERATDGKFDVLYAPGYAFVIDCEIEISLPEIREIRCSRQYGPLIVSGQVDAIDGLMVIDHKTTASMDAERFLAGYQWRFYLDIHSANVFRWNVFEIRKTSYTDEEQIYTVSGFHQLEQHRYDGLHEDCERLAAEFYDFAGNYLPGYGYGTRGDR